MSTLTVKQLIKLLRKCPPDLPVYTEGCDCTGDAVDVCVYPGASVEIMRARRSGGLRPPPTKKERATADEKQRQEREALERATRRAEEYYGSEVQKPALRGLELIGVGQTSGVKIYGPAQARKR